MGMLKKGNVQLSGGRCPSPEALARHHGPTLNGTPELGRRQTKGPVARTAIIDAAPHFCPNHFEPPRVQHQGEPIRSRKRKMKPSERIDQHIAGIDDWRGEVLATIRRIMLEADPAVTEDWKWMGTPVWYCDGMVSLGQPSPGEGEVDLRQGGPLRRPDHLFNAGLEGNEWRAIDIFEKDRPDEAALRRLVKTAIAYNRSQLKGNDASATSPKAARRPRVTKKRS